MPREIGDWTLEKLRILEDYLPIYLQATTRTLERIYIDAFAGPGRNRLKATSKTVDGSPLVALKARAKNGTRFSRLFFIEQDEAIANELRESVAETGTGSKARVIRGDVNDELPKLVRSLPRRSPAFIFLDTEGIEPKWSTLEAIAPWQVELLINFPLGMSINRNPNSDKVNQYFGTDAWRRIWESSVPGRTRDLLDLYKNRLKDLGFEYTTDVDPLITDSLGHPLYYLIFVSKVEPAKRIMKWVQEQPDSAGQLRFKF
jgi:three-Cys-motif partner protein